MQSHALLGHEMRDLGMPGEFYAEAAQILEEVRRALERGPRDAHEAALRLMSFLKAPTAAEPAPARGGLAPWQRRKVDRHLHEQLEQPVRVEELAELVGLSTSHFCRAFKESFAHTPHAYIIRLRLERAQELMLATADPLSQIALASGFADQAHLCKLFRRAIGATPNAWRRQNRTDARIEAQSRRAS